MEPENRLVARTLEKAWEDKLRVVDEIEQEYRRWRDREPLVLQAADHAALQELAENLPAIWHSETNQPEGRKRRNQRTSNPTSRSILRFELWRDRACA
ncbi:hypothetical protein [Mesorhizobium sp. M0522]|uniref:hypothetical protein n=1 Tax=Mesorhizobium sp. M0522 TaxID=2956958 RepID=UPI003334B4BA